MAICRLWQVADLRFNRIRLRTFETTLLVLYRPVSVSSSKHLLENNLRDDEGVGMIQAFSRNYRHIRRWTKDSRKARSKTEKNRSLSSAKIVLMERTLKTCVIRPDSRFPHYPETMCKCFGGVTLGELTVLTATHVSEDLVWILS